MSKELGKHIFRTYDEEPDPAVRISSEVEKYLEMFDMDTVNKEYIIVLEVTEVS